MIRDDSCVINDGYVIDKYYYTGKQNEIEELIKKCVLYNSQESRNDRYYNKEYVET